MPSRESLKLQAQVQSIDNHSSTATDLFKTVDRDGSGTITEEEFSKAFDVIRNVVKGDRSDLEQSRRRGKALCGVAIFSGLLLFLSFAGNMGLMYMLLQLTKDMHLKQAPAGAAADIVGSGSGSVMTNGVGETLSTSNTLQIFDDAAELPLLGPNFNYISISYLRLPQIRPRPSIGLNETIMVGYAVQGYRWYSLTDLDLMLSMDTTLHITKYGLELSRTSEAAGDFFFDMAAEDDSGRRLASIQTVYVGAGGNVAGGVSVQEPTSTTSGSRVCPATQADFNKNRNCFDVWAKKCIKCGGGSNGIAANTGNSLTSFASSGSSSGSSSYGTTTRLCPRTWGDVKNKRTCWQQAGNKCVRCKPDANDGDDYLLGGGATSRVCPANTADANANRNCYDVWKKKCVVCSGSFKDVENDDN